VLPLHDFLLVWAILLLNVLTPGPNVINTIATAMAAGRVAGVGAAVGVGLGVGGWCLATTFGIATLFRLVPGLQYNLSFVAIGLLAWFALRYLRGAWAGWCGVRRGMPVLPRQDSFGSAFWRSLMINWVNPKALTTWLAILTIFPVARAQGADVALLWAGAVTVAGGMHVGYALVFSTGPAARFYLRYGWVMSGVAGVLFALFAARLLVGQLAA
jgi:threonine/homoserine/homoserine lactone efflux protein